MLFTLSSLSIYHLVLWYDELPEMVQHLTVLAQAGWFIYAAFWLELIQQLSGQEWAAVAYRLAMWGLVYAFLSHLPDISRFFDYLAEILPLPAF